MPCIASRMQLGVSPCTVNWVLISCENVNNVPINHGLTYVHAVHCMEKSGMCTNQEHMSHLKGGEGVSDCMSDVLGEVHYIYIYIYCKN